MVQEVTHFDVHRVLSDDEWYRTNPAAVSTDALVRGQRPHPDDQCRDACKKNHSTVFRHTPKSSLLLNVLGTKCKESEEFYNRKARTLGSAYIFLYLGSP